MEAVLNFKEFAYRSSLSVISKSALNFGAMISAFLSFDIEEDVFDEMRRTPAAAENKKTQSQKIREKNIIKVAIIKDKAYFVHENTFYTAKLIDGEVDRSSASPINAFDISKKEMQKLLSILDNMNL